MPAPLNKHAFGIHITDATVKIAELAPVKGNFHLIAYGERRLPPDLVVDGAIRDSRETAKQIRELIEKPMIGQLKTSYVVSSLPESRVFLKAINLPRFSEKQLTEAISWEARSLLPVQPERAYHQSQILVKGEKNITALIAATEKNLVNEYLRTLHLAGLIPIAFDLECYAAARTIEESELDNHVLLLVHIGTNVTTLTVLRDGQVWFSRTINAGMSFLGQEAIESNSLSIKKAEIILKQWKTRGGGAKKLIENLGSGIQSTVKYYQEQLGEEKHQVEGIILTGGSASIPGLADILGKQVSDLPVKVAKPRHQLTEKLLSVRSRLPLLISIGLALRGAHPARWEKDLNFLPEQIISEREAQEIRGEITRLLALLGYISIGVALVLSFFLWSFFASYQHVKESMVKQKQIVDNHSAQELFSWVEEANVQLGLMNELENTRLPFGQFLKRISTSVPDGVVFETLTYSNEEKRFQVSGIANTRTHVLAFAQKLQEDQAISDLTVPLGSFNKDRDVEFTISFFIDPEKL